MVDKHMRLVVVAARGGGKAWETDRHGTLLNVIHLHTASGMSQLKVVHTLKLRKLQFGKFISQSTQRNMCVSTARALKAACDLP